MFPHRRILLMACLRFLCTCRDVSNGDVRREQAKGFSLHMQRCFHLCLAQGAGDGVFSAHAEMFLQLTNMTWSEFRFLCTCRDVSEKEEVRGLRMVVFSAHAEMFLWKPLYLLLRRGFLCTCRDVSQSLAMP